VKAPFTPYRVRSVCKAYPIGKFIAIMVGRGNVPIEVAASKYVTNVIGRNFADK